MEFIISAIVGYILGSIPSAYILVKLVKGVDIREHGSGNVGALNAYEVSGSALVGIVVLVFDILKGYMSIEISQIFFGGNFFTSAVAGIFAVLGHNFSAWISFKGGRGLATSLGVFILLNPSLVILWCILWTIAYALTRHVHTGNIWATTFTPVLVSTSVKFFNSFSTMEVGDKVLLGFTLIISALIFIKHIGPLKAIIRERKFMKNKIYRWP
jgi:glycerol-3-phosphate acyltransferase PlsY